MRILLWKTPKNWQVNYNILTISIDLFHIVMYIAGARSKLYSQDFKSWWTFRQTKCSMSSQNALPTHMFSPLYSNSLVCCRASTASVGFIWTVKNCRLMLFLSSKEQEVLTSISLILSKSPQSLNSSWTIWLTSRWLLKCGEPRRLRTKKRNCQLDSRQLVRTQLKNRTHLLQLTRKQLKNRPMESTQR